MGTFRPDDDGRSDDEDAKDDDGAEEGEVEVSLLLEIELRLLEPLGDRPVPCRRRAMLSTA